HLLLIYTYYVELAHYIRILPATHSPSIYIVSILKYTHHLHLHSFPTRRSSDLIVLLACRAGQALLCDNGKHAWASSGFDFIYFRSEEHTSELQSRFDLVCRLLLEIKKKSTSN